MTLWQWTLAIVLTAITLWLSGLLFLRREPPDPFDRARRTASSARGLLAIAALFVVVAVANGLRTPLMWVGLACGAVLAVASAVRTVRTW